MRTEKAEETTKPQNKRPKKPPPKETRKTKTKTISGEDFLSNSIPLGIVFYFTLFI